MVFVFFSRRSMYGLVTESNSLLDKVRFEYVRYFESVCIDHNRLFILGFYSKMAIFV